MVRWYGREAADECEWRIAAENVAQDVGVEAEQGQSSSGGVRSRACRLLL